MFPFTGPVRVPTMDELQQRLAAARARAEAAASRSSPLAPASAASGAGPPSSQADSADASKAQQPRASWQKELDARRQRKSANSVPQIASATEDASAESDAAPTSGHHAAPATPFTNGAQDESRATVSPPSVALGTPGAPSASPPPRAMHPPSAAERTHDANAAAAAAVVTLAEAHGGGGREPSPMTAVPPEGGGQKNYTLWNELVAVRGENDALGQELSTARAANERLSLILSGMSERLRAQLEALLRRGLHTEERIQMFGELKELLSFEEQFEQVQAIAPSPRSARNAAADVAGGRLGAVMGADWPCASASSTAGAAGASASTAELYRNPLAPAFIQKGSSASTAELVAAGEAALVAWKPKLAASPPPTLPPPTPSPPTRAPPTTAPSTAAPPTSPPPRAVARGLPPLQAHEEREPSPFAPPPSAFADAEPSLAATALAGLTHGSPVRRVEAATAREAMAAKEALAAKEAMAAKEVLAAKEAMAAKEAALDLANAALAKASAAEAAEAEATAMAANASAAAKDLAKELAISRGSRQDLANELAILRMEASVAAATAARALAEMEQQAALTAAQAAQALEEARAEALSARLRSDSTVFAANRRCEAEIAEARMRARAAVHATEEQSEAAVREAQDIAKAAAASAALAEEELRRERARGQVERATHASEAERWRAALEEARAEAERCRRSSAVLGADAERYRRSSLGEAHARQPAPSPPLAATLSASAQAERVRAQHKRPPPPLASQHTPTSVPKRPVEIRRDSTEAEVDMPSGAGGGDAALMDALMDRIVLTRHWEYIMQGAGSPGDATPGSRAAAVVALELQ